MPEAIRQTAYVRPEKALLRLVHRGLRSRLETSLHDVVMFRDDELQPDQEGLNRLTDLRHLADRYGSMIERHVLPIFGASSASLASQLSISIAHTRAAAADMDALIAQARRARGGAWRALIRLIEYQAHQLAKAILAQTNWEGRFLPLAAMSAPAPGAWRVAVDHIVEELGPIDRVCLLKPALPAVRLHERFSRTASLLAPAHPGAPARAGFRGAGDADRRSGAPT